MRRLVLVLVLAVILAADAVLAVLLGALGVVSGTTLYVGAAVIVGVSLAVYAGVLAVMRIRGSRAVAALPRLPRRVNLLGRLRREAEHGAYRRVDHGDYRKLEVRAQRAFAEVTRRAFSVWQVVQGWWPHRPES